MPLRFSIILAASACSKHLVRQGLFTEALVMESCTSCSNAGSATLAFTSLFFNNGNILLKGRNNNMALALARHIHASMNSL